MLGKLFPLRVEGLEAVGAHAGVFGRIQRATSLYDDGVEFVEEMQGFLTTVGEIECEGQARPWKREHAWRWNVAKCFQDCKERAFACLSNASEDFAHGCAGIVKGDDELVLQEAALAVHAVPVVDGIKGVEEWIVGDCFMDYFACLGVVVEFVKCFYGERVEREGGQVEWQGKRQAFFDGFGGKRL